MSTLSYIHVGADEVGRGSLLGPLVVGAVANAYGWRDAQVKDSKKIKSEVRMKEIAQRIQDNTIWHVSFCPASLINRLGMAECLQQTFLRAIKGIIARARAVNPIAELDIVVDGNPQKLLEPLVASHHVELRFAPRADAEVFEVAAASILAKSMRDQWCHDTAAMEPDLRRYDIDSNKGYTSPTHIAGLKLHGPTPYHRVEFVATLMNTLAKKEEKTLWTT